LCFTPRFFSRFASRSEFSNRVELLAFGLVDHVRLVVADHRAIGGHHQYVQVVDLGELGRLGVGGAGHARNLVVHAEVVLEGDRGVGLTLALDLDALLRLHRLVQAIGPATPGHQPAGELVDDHHLRTAALAGLHHVLHVALLERMGHQRLVHRVQDRQRLGIVEVLHLQHLLDAVDALLGERRLMVLFVDPVVPGLLDPVLRIGLGTGLEPGDHLVRHPVDLGVVLGRARDDQRRAGLVDQDRVHLVHDRVVQIPLDEVLEPGLHVVPQVVEAELVVGAVCDVRGVGLAPIRLRDVVNDAADREAEEAMDLPHPLGVPGGQEVVDRHHVDALAGEAVQVGGQRRHEGLALAGLHLGDAPLVQHRAADQLHVEMTLADGALHRLADGGEGLRQQIIERLAVLEALAEIDRARREGGVRELHGSRSFFVPTRRCRKFGISGRDLSRRGRVRGM
jgi:hypothetical protein